MRFSHLYESLKRNNYYVFSHQDMLTFFPNETKANLKRMVCRWVQRGWIQPLKRGLYELSYPNELIIPDMYIANKLYSPSYVSLETALSHYSIIPEVSMAVTCVTTKPTRRFKNKHGLFLYRTIQPEAYKGYYVERQGDFSFLIAEPEKAFIDYLYFRTYRNKKARFCFDEERFDKQALMCLKKTKLNQYSKLFHLDLKEFYAYLHSLN